MAGLNQQYDLEDNPVDMPADPSVSASEDSAMTAGLDTPPAGATPEPAGPSPYDANVAYHNAVTAQQEAHQKRVDAEQAAIEKSGGNPTKLAFWQKELGVEKLKADEAKAAAAANTLGQKASKAPTGNPNLQIEAEQRARNAKPPEEGGIGAGVTDQERIAAAQRAAAQKIAIDRQDSENQRAALAQAGATARANLNYNSQQRTLAVSQGRLSLDQAIAQQRADEAHVTSTQKAWELMLRAQGEEVTQRGQDMLFDSKNYGTNVGLIQRIMESQVATRGQDIRAATALAQEMAKQNVAFYGSRAPAGTNEYYRQVALGNTSARPPAGGTHVPVQPLDMNQAFNTSLSNVGSQQQPNYQGATETASAMEPTRQSQVDLSQTQEGIAGSAPRLPDRVSGINTNPVDTSGFTGPQGGASSPQGSQGGSPIHQLISKYAPPDLGNDTTFHSIVLSAISAESGGDTNRVGDSGHSLGLYQMHDEGAGKGMGASRADPDAASKVMVPKFAEAYKVIRAKFPNASGAQLAALVAGYAERPEGTSKEGILSASSKAYKNYVSAWNSNFGEEA